MKIKNEIDLHLVDDVDGMLTKEVYARFGLAYFLTECLHRGLCVFYTFATYQNRSDITGPRTEEKLAFSFSLTMGKLFNELEALFPPEMELSPKIEHILDRRNYLAHHFWFEQAHLMVSNNGLSKMVTELSQLVTEFEELEKEVEILVGEQIKRLDVDEQIFVTAFEEVLAGKPWESFLQKRGVNNPGLTSGAFNPMQASLVLSLLFPGTLHISLSSVHPSPLCSRNIQPTISLPCHNIAPE